jgi:hypothetical protein
MISTVHKERGRRLLSAEECWKGRRGTVIGTQVKNRDNPVMAPLLNGTPKEVLQCYEVISIVANRAADEECCMSGAVKKC